MRGERRGKGEREGEGNGIKRENISAEKLDVIP